MLSLTIAIASSSSRNFVATTSGANASFEQTAAVRGTSVRIVGGKNVPSALPPTRILPPRSTASSTQRWVRDAAFSSTIGPTSVVGSSGSPTLSAAAPAEELVHELVPDVLVDERPLDADADLARIGEAADEVPLDGPVDVRRTCRR